MENFIINLRINQSPAISFEVYDLAACHHFEGKRVIHCTTTTTAAATAAAVAAAGTAADVARTTIAAFHTAFLAAAAAASRRLKGAERSEVGPPRTSEGL